MLQYVSFLNWTPIGGSTLETTGKLLQMFNPYRGSGAEAGG